MQIARHARVLIAAIILSSPGCSGPQPAELAATEPMPATAPSDTRATMTVRVTDLRNHSGKLILSVYRSADGFIGNPGKAVATQSKSIDADVMTFTLDLPPGAYAVCVLHDENANQKMDTNLIGIPKEGYGVTNNPKPRFRVAKFGEARIALPAEGAAFDISLQYF